PPAAREPRPRQDDPVLVALAQRLADDDPAPRRRAGEDGADHHARRAARPRGGGARAGRCARGRGREDGDHAVSSGAGPRFSVCEITTFPATFEEDLRIYRDAGADGISIVEGK